MKELLKECLLGSYASRINSAKSVFVKTANKLKKISVEINKDIVEKTEEVHEIQKEISGLEAMGCEIDRQLKELSKFI